jgi:hypothetical protein
LLFPEHNGWFAFWTAWPHCLFIVDILKGVTCHFLSRTSFQIQDIVLFNGGIMHQTLPYSRTVQNEGTFQIRDSFKFHPFHHIGLFQASGWDRLILGLMFELHTLIRELH